MLSGARFLGQGIERDPTQAPVLLLLARAGGSSLATTYRTAVEASLDPQGRLRATEIAREMAGKPPWSGEGTP